MTCVHASVMSLLIFNDGLTDFFVRSFFKFHWSHLFLWYEPKAAWGTYINFASSMIPNESILQAY